MKIGLRKNLQWCGVRQKKMNFTACMKLCFKQRIITTPSFCREVGPNHCGKKAKKSQIMCTYVLIPGCYDGTFIPILRGIFRSLANVHFISLSKKKKSEPLIYLHMVHSELRQKLLYVGFTD